MRLVLTLVLAARLQFGADGILGLAGHVGPRNNTGKGNRAVNGTGWRQCGLSRRMAASSRKGQDAGKDKQGGAAQAQNSVSFRQAGTASSAATMESAKALVPDVPPTSRVRVVFSVYTLSSAA